MPTVVSSNDYTPSIDVQICSIELAFHGSLSSKESIKNAEFVIGRIFTAASAYDFNHRILADGHVFHFRGLKVERNGLIEGSILERLKFITSCAVTAYGLVAAYPSFKEALPIIEKDINNIIENALWRIPVNQPEKRPLDIDIYYLKEDDFVEDTRRIK